MIKQNISIINYDSLYEILDEIKENLSFRIIKYESETDFIKVKGPNLDIKNSLIISKTNNNLLLKKDLDNKNLLNFDNFPLSLKALVELINIQLIKLKYNYH